MSETRLAAELSKAAENWRNAYDPRTGRLGESWYYEGSGANYSFRLLHDMPGRMALSGGPEKFVEDLDRFFGFGAPPCEQPLRPPYDDIMKKGFALGRFEGLNNEPDLDAPYAYIYAGRHDRTAEVVRACMGQEFSIGRGGLPGNDDSGGTSSWYVLSAIGLFPVPGQNAILVGSPIFDSAAIKTADREFIVETRNNSNLNIYVQGASLNGRPLARACLTCEELLQGGTLRLDMGDKPSAWSRGNPGKGLLCE